MASGSNTVGIPQRRNVTESWNELKRQPQDPVGILLPKSVVRELLADDAVGSDQIEDLQVTAPKINVPSFAAYRSAAYNTIASGTVIDWDAEEWDSEGWFDLTANSFTPLQAGVYLLTWELSIASAQLAANTVLSANLRKNGSTHRAGPVIMANGTNSTAAGGTALVVANGVDDDFDVVVSWTDVGNNNFNVGAANTYFHGHFVSADS